MQATRLAFGLALLVAGTLSAQAPTVSGSFVSTLGVDTIAVERYTRTGDKLEGEILQRFPRVRVIQYVADMAGGRFRGMSIAARRVNPEPTAPPTFSMVTIFSDSTAAIEVQRNGRADTTISGKRVFKGRFAPAFPSAPAAFGVYEQVLAFNPPVDRDTMTVVTLGAGANGTLSLVRRSRDTVAFVSSFSPGWVELVSVDANGRITGVDGTATTVKAITRRASGVDFDALAKSWAAVEAARGIAGQMSPPDTTRAVIGSASIEIAYSRPQKRGRQIWGAVVPWNAPWRTGANAATQLTTSADLIFGTTVVPAGKYTLWTLPTPTGTKLIINSQTGQWGTEYHAERDLTRLDMTQTALAQPAERFTIAVSPQGSSGVLRVSWDDREYSIPFRVK